MNKIKLLSITMYLLSCVVLLAGGLSSNPSKNQITATIEAKILQAIKGDVNGRRAYQSLQIDILNWEPGSHLMIDEWLSTRRQGFKLGLDGCDEGTSCFTNLDLYFGVSKQQYRRKASLLTELTFQLSEEGQETNHITLLKNRTLGIIGPLNNNKVKSKSFTLTLQVKEILDLVRTGNTGLDFNFTRIRASLAAASKGFIPSNLVSKTLMRKILEGDFEIVVQADNNSYEALDLIRRHKPLGSAGLKNDLEIDVELLRREFGEAINKKLGMTSFLLLQARRVSRNTDKKGLKQKNFKSLYSNQN